MLIPVLYRFCVGGSGVGEGLKVDFHALRNPYRVDLLGGLSVWGACSQAWTGGFVASCLALARRWVS
jgi:hypothetical protein